MSDDVERTMRAIAIDVATEVTKNDLRRIEARLIEMEKWADASSLRATKARWACIAAVILVTALVVTFCLALQ